MEFDLRLEGYIMVADCWQWFVVDGIRQDKELTLAAFYAGNWYKCTGFRLCRVYGDR